MKLTICQEKGKDKMLRWSKTKATKSLSDRIFVLTGKAGTGKTTLIKYVLKEFLNESKVDRLSAYTYPDVLGVCMAHAAKEILRESIPDVTTFASYFGFTIKHHNNGVITFEKEYWNKNQANVCDLPIKFVIHDECSMYDQKMLNTVLEDTHRDTKIILMGDPGQLPPINEDSYDADSPTFIMPIAESSKHHLITRVRQSEDNPIVELSDVIYDEIFGELKKQSMINVYNAIRLNKNNGKIGYQTISTRDFVKKYADSSEDYLDSKVIAYRNLAIDNNNSVIRYNRFGNVSDRFVVDDVIVLKDTYYHATQAENNQPSHRWVMYNSDQYKIIDITKTKFKGIMCWDLYVDKGHKKYLEYKTKPFIRVVCPEGQQAYDAELSRLYHMAELEKSDKKRRKELFSDYWSFKTFFGNVAYGYCLTAYKAQGSTFKTVFIDINDIIGTKPISRKRKLQSIYTALTRATDMAYFITLKKIYESLQKMS